MMIYKYLKIRSFLIFLYAFGLLFAANSNAINIKFENFVELNNCVPFSDNISEYASNLEKCFNDKNYEFTDDFISSLRESLPKNFFERVSLGEETEKYIPNQYIAKNAEITIDDYINKFPNQIYAVDTYLRGQNAIIEKHNLNKIDLLQRLYGSLPVTPIVSTYKTPKQKKQEFNIATSIF